MLKEVTSSQFWTKLPLKPRTIRESDVQQYLDETGVVGYLNTVVRRYFLVVKTEPGDLDFVRGIKISQTIQDIKHEKKEHIQIDIFKKYSHAIPGTLESDSVHKKKKVRILCTCCGDTKRWVFTSDLFQVNKCSICQSKVKEARKVKHLVATGV